MHKRQLKSIKNKWRWPGLYTRQFNVTFINKKKLNLTAGTQSARSCVCVCVCVCVGQRPHRRETEKKIISGHEETLCLDTLTLTALSLGENMRQRKRERRGCITAFFFFFCT